MFPLFLETRSWSSTTKLSVDWVWKNCELNHQNIIHNLIKPETRNAIITWTKCVYFFYRVESHTHTVNISGYRKKQVHLCLSKFFFSSWTIWWHILMNSKIISEIHFPNHLQSSAPRESNNLTIKVLFSFHKKISEDNGSKWNFLIHTYESEVLSRNPWWILWACSWDISMDDWFLISFDSIWILWYQKLNQI